MVIRGLSTDRTQRRGGVGFCDLVGSRRRRVFLPIWSSVTHSLRRNLTVGETVVSLSVLGKRKRIKECSLSP